MCCLVAMQDLLVLEVRVDDAEANHSFNELVVLHLPRPVVPVVRVLNLEVGKHEHLCAGVAFLANACPHAEECRAIAAPPVVSTSDAFATVIFFPIKPTCTNARICKLTGVFE